MVEHLKNAAGVPTWMPLGWEKQDEVASRVDFQWTRLKFILWCFFSRQGEIKHRANVLWSALNILQSVLLEVLTGGKCNKVSHTVPFRWKKKNTLCPLRSSQYVERPFK